VETAAVKAGEGGPMSGRIHAEFEPARKGLQVSFLLFFSVQRRMASARSFNMFPSMLHMGLINHAFFFRPTPYGFRQVVQHVPIMLHVRLIN